MFEDCLGLRKKNGRTAFGRYLALAISLVLHGLLIYGFIHARLSIKMLSLGKQVQNVRIVPPVRLSMPRIVGGRPQGTPPAGAVEAESAGGGSEAGVRPAARPAPRAAQPGPSAATAAPGVAPQGPVIPSLAAKFQESLSSRYRTGQGSGLVITLSPPGAKPTTGTAPAKGTWTDFYQYVTGTPVSGGAGTGGTGAGGGGQRASISIPLKGYNLGPWAQKVLELIMKNWNLPLTTGLAEMTRVKVIIVVRKTGELASIELVEGAPRDLLDAAALEAVRASLPFPALPDDFPGDFLEASIEFTYHD